MFMAHRNISDHYSSNEVAEQYHASFSEGTNNPSTMQKAIDSFYKFLRIVEDSGHILDAGCGTGRFVKYFTRKGYRVTGIDTSSAMLEIAKRENPDTEFVNMDMRILRFPADHFDGIWNSGCILHLDESGVAKTFKESSRVLRNDGAFFVATIVKDKDTVVLEESREGGEILVHYYSKEKLKLFLNRAGFEILEISTEPDDFGRPFEYCYMFTQNAKGEITNI